MIDPTTLVCVRCEKEWTPGHDCDVAHGDTLVQVVKTEDWTPNEN